MGAPADAILPAADFAVAVACGSSEEFFGTLEQEHHLARSDLTFERVRLAPEGTSFRLDWLDTQGTRTFRDPDCRTLFRTAIVIAVSSVRDREASEPPTDAPDAQVLAPVAAGAAATGAAAGGPEGEVPESPIEVAEPLTPETPTRVEKPTGRPKSVPRPRDRRTGNPLRVRGEGGIALGGAVALFPKPAFFAELSGGLVLGRAGTSLSVRYLPRSKANTSESLGIQLEAWGGRLGAFYEPLRWLRADLGLGVTYLIGTGLGVRNPGSDGVWLFAPELDASARLLAEDPFSLDLGLRGWVALNTPRFEIDGEGEIYRVPPAGAAFFLRGRLGSR